MTSTMSLSRGQDDLSAGSEPAINSVRARTLGFLASLALRAMEARDITARLEAVERVLKMRRQAAEEVEEAKRKRRW